MNCEGWGYLGSCSKVVGTRSICQALGSVPILRSESLISVFQTVFILSVTKQHSQYRNNVTFENVSERDRKKITNLLTEHAQ